MERWFERVQSGSSHFHLSFEIFHFEIGGFLFVLVRVNSWIVLRFSAKQAIHEITRSSSQGLTKLQMENLK